MEKKEIDFSRKVLSFFLDYIRYILVITQLIVIGVFFYRFSIDQNIIDFKDSIRSRQEIIKETKPLVQEIEKTDFQLKEIKKIVSLQGAYEEMIEYAFSEFPASITLSKLSVENNAMSFDGFSQNARDLQSFYAKLKQGKRFETTQLENVKRVDNGYTFTMQLKKFAQKKQPT